MKSDLSPINGMKAPFGEIRMKVNLLPDIGKPRPFLYCRECLVKRVSRRRGSTGLCKSCGRKG